MVGGRGVDDRLRLLVEVGGYRGRGGRMPAVALDRRPAPRSQEVDHRRIACRSLQVEQAGRRRWVTGSRPLRCATQRLGVLVDVLPVPHPHTIILGERLRQSKVPMGTNR